MKETQEQFVETENHARTLVRQGYCGEESSSSWVNRQRRAERLGDRMLRMRDDEPRRGIWEKKAAGPCR